MLTEHEVETNMARKSRAAKIEMRKRLAANKAMQSAAMTVALRRGANHLSCVAGPDARKRLPSSTQLSLI